MHDRCVRDERLGAQLAALVAQHVAQQADAVGQAVRHEDGRRDAHEVDDEARGVA